MIRCLHCGAETSNGLALCQLCFRKAEMDLAFLPVYFRNLARWRPGRAGSRPVPGSRVLYDGSRGGTGDRINDRLDETANALITWADVLVEARPYLGRLLDRLATAKVTEAEGVAWLCAGFSKYLTSIATTDWCGDLVRDLSHHEYVLCLLTETTVPGWYAGACRHCGAGTYVVPGLTWVRCGGCGSTTYARDHLETVLDEARPWVAPPKRLAEAIVALVDTEQSVPRLHDRIRQWGSRGRIEAWRRTDVDGDEVGPKRYRLGDVLDVLFAEGGTRSEVATQSA